jgi:hypothetical protein
MKPLVFNDLTDDGPEVLIEQPAPQTNQPITLDKITRAYLRIRDARAERKKAFEAEDVQLKEAQESLAATMLNEMNESGIQSFRTKHGTVYLTEDILPAAFDWDLFYQYVAENMAFDALHKRITKEFVSTYMEQNNGEAPPGVSVIRKNVVNVRRKN